jgi:hypothetical protein
MGIHLVKVSKRLTDDWTITREGCHGCHYRLNRRYKLRFITNRKPGSPGTAMGPESQNLGDQDLASYHPQRL